MLHLREQAVITALPTGEQLVAVVEHFGIGHLFCRGNQCQSFIRRAAVVEDHGGFNGVIDRAGDQVQVVIGIHAQRQHAKHRQGNTGQAHRQQGHAQVATPQHCAQGRTLTPPAKADHGCVARRRDNCSTEGWMRTPLRATESRLTSNATWRSLTRRQNTLPTVQGSSASLMLKTG
ncbi:hypothetical protein D9M71_419940 [compost metagenome]